MSGRDPAARRWAAIQLVRALGVAAVLVGIAVARRVEPFDTVPGWLGLVVLLAGVALTFLVPMRLARRWRTRPS